MVVASLGLLVWAVKNPRSAVERTTWLKNVPHVRDRNVDEALSRLLVGLSDTVTTRRLAVLFAMFGVAWAFLWASYAMALDAAPVGDKPLLWELAVAALILAIMPPATATMVIVFQVIITSALVVGRLAEPSSAIAYSVVLQLPQIVLFTALGAWGLAQTGLGPRSLIRDARRDMSGSGDSAITND
jgi:hypothetical protein